MNIAFLAVVPFASLALVGCSSKVVTSLGDASVSTSDDARTADGSTVQPSKEAGHVGRDASTRREAGSSGDGSLPACGVGDAMACGSGNGCTSGLACASFVCAAGPIVGDGGSDGGAVDCASARCECQPPSPADGVKNDSETDIDCGGGFLADGMPNAASDGAPVCAHGRACALGTDCADGVCNANGDTGGPPIDCPPGATGCTCQLPSDTDGVKNDSETDVDCGGGASAGSDGAALCAPMLHCLVGADCTSEICGAGGLCTSASPTDGIQNDSETDVDCGGAVSADGTPNTMSDGAPACAAGSMCVNDSDCMSDGCDYTNHCALSASCTQHHGGDTCGAGEDTDLGAMPTAATGEESCCTSLPIPGTTYTVDKYLITAGRIRAFVDRFDGDLQSFTSTIPASNPYWSASWNQFIPSTRLLVDEQLGPYPAPLTPDPYPPSDTTVIGANPAFQGGAGNEIGQWRYGCTMGNPAVAGGSPNGARTWWSDGKLGGDAAPIVYPQEFLDDKTINCIDAYMLTAFCIWDGGHLATIDELDAAWGAGAYPWSAGPNGASKVGIVSTNDSYPQEPSGTDDNGLSVTSYVAHEFGTEFESPYTYNYDPFQLYIDNSYHIASPGRFPLGAGPHGHMDLAGAALQAAAITPYTGAPVASPTSLSQVDAVNGIWSGSWEVHLVLTGQDANHKQVPFRAAWFAYWAMSGRCAR